MENTKEFEVLPDFSASDYTIIISDLHLTQEHITDPNNPLWKKYLTRQFYFDHTFSDFLDHIDQKIKSDNPDKKPIVELVLNGDIFDFDSVTSIPEEPTYKVSWLETRRGLYSEEVKSVYKLEVILRDHKEWFDALRRFVLKGHRAIFVTGNHDLELLFPQVQERLIESLNLPAEFKHNVRFCDWFYISNKDTLIEHGNQYDPFCVCQNPIHPMIRKYNRIEMRIPFGNLATRYMINGMGFFNPYVDTGFIMTIKDYLTLFFKYMARKQPLLVISWFWGASAVLYQSLSDRLYPAVKDPLLIEDRIEWIAKKANAQPRMVREMRELAVSPATSNPLMIAQELWLDRALLFLLGLLVIFQIFSLIKLVYDISFFWMFIPILLFTPFFTIYSKSVYSYVAKFKEPRERVMNQSSQITHVKRVIYGHTHVLRHEIIGIVEHLNSGTWSSAFLDIECTKSFSQKTCVWIEPGKDGQREASLLEFVNGSLKKSH
jgi:UDP-2,3-diacylglucosamine pyrophosphatase LpxH